VAVNRTWLLVSTVAVDGAMEKVPFEGFELGLPPPQPAITSTKGAAKARRKRKGRVIITIIQGRCNCTCPACLPVFDDTLVACHKSRTAENGVPGETRNGRGSCAADARHAEEGRRVRKAGPGQQQKIAIPTEAKRNGGTCFDAELAKNTADPFAPCFALRQDDDLILEGS
jgi:hypothetical protein